MAESGTPATDTGAPTDGTSAAAVVAPTMSSPAAPAPTPKSTQPQVEILSPLPKSEDTAPATPPPTATPPAADWEKRYKDAQASYTKSQQEQVELRERLARVEGAQSAQQAQAQQPSQTPYWDTPEFQERYQALADDSPAKAEAYAAQMQEQHFAQIVYGMQAQQDAKFAAMVAAATNPERAKVQDTLNALTRDVQGFGGLPAEMQLQLAKAAHANTDADEAGETVIPPASSPAGTGIPAPTVDTGDEYAKSVKAMSDKIFGPPPGSEPQALYPTYQPLRRG